MNSEVQQKKSRKTAAPFTLEQARGEILAKLRKAASKGTGSFFTAKTATEKRELLAQALVELEVEREITVDRRKAKPKFFLPEFAPKLPDLASVAAKLAQFAAAQYPQLLSGPELKRALPKGEAPLFMEALEALLQTRTLVELKRKASVFYISGAALGIAPETAAVEEAPVAPVAPEQIRESYRELARDTGFPAVAIAALQRASGAPMEELKRWIMVEHRHGQAVLSFGDWSLADEAKRAGAIELGGDRYLLVRLAP
jgi:hypothetical protein